VAAPAAAGASSGQVFTIEKSIVIPVPAAELKSGRRIQLKLDFTIEPQG
jgi:hypothetical protein